MRFKSKRIADDHCNKWLIEIPYRLELLCQAKLNAYRFVATYLLIRIQYNIVDN